MSPDGKAPIGLVLSGGGALGAYEVGVLAHLAATRPAMLDRIRVVTGSSVGAINAAFLVSRGLTPEAVDDLARLWRSMEVDRLVNLSHLSTLKMLAAGPLRLFRRNVASPATGILDPRGLWRMVKEVIDWNGLHRNLAGDGVRSLAVAATEIGSGRTRLFVEGGEPARRGRTPEFDVQRVNLDRRHILASSAIPLLFPPIRIDERWYMDGGIRNNTPLSPALRLGAESLLIVNVRGRRSDPVTGSRYPGIGRIIGDLLDSVFMDRVAFDLDRLARINDVVSAAGYLEAGGASFREALAVTGRPDYRPVEFVSIQPETGFGRLAAECLAQGDALGPCSFLRVLGALFEDDVHTTGEAASFLLFDGAYAGLLIEAGRADAEASDAEFDRL